MATDSPEPDIDEQYETDMPDDAKQDELIEISQTDADIFKQSIVKIINDNIDKFNVLELNKNNDETNTTMTKESFAAQFDGTFKPQLLEIIFDTIDEQSTGIITNAAMISFLSNKAKHPPREPTQIDPKWLFKTIKKLNFGQLDINNDREVSLEEMKTYFADIKNKQVSDEIVTLVFNEIDSNHKGYISMKDFFQWRDKFDANRLRTWSHTLSKTVIMTGLEGLIEEINEEHSDDFEMIGGNPSDDNKTSDDFEKIDTSTNEKELLNDILLALNVGTIDDQQTIEISNVIKESVAKLQYQLADARYASIKHADEKKKHLETQEDKKLIQSQVSMQRAATKKLSKELTQLMGKDVSTDDPKQLILAIQQLQHIMSEERLDRMREKQLFKDEIAKLEYNLGDANYAMSKLKKDLTETLGEHLVTDDPHQIAELLQKVQYQLAEERMDGMRQRRQSIQLTDKINKINYELADERLQLLELKETIQDILEIDIESFDENSVNLKDLLIKLKQQVNDEFDFNQEGDNKLNRREKAEQASMAKADEKIKTIDIEEELKQIENDPAVHYNNIDDIGQLKKIIQSLHMELKNSRTDHLAVSETKTHLEVQTFDLQTKLHSEKKKFTKLLRMSQQMAGFDPKLLDMEATEQGLQPPLLEEEEREHDSEGSDGGDSTHVYEEMEHMESWNGTAQELDDEINRLQSELDKSHKQISTVKQENQRLSERINTLQSTNRNHRRRESEVFTAIGDDAKNVIEQFEELEENRKKMENDALQLAYLQAEQRRMEIAYEHARANATKYRLESTNLKSKLKDLEEKNAEIEELNIVRDKLLDLENQVKENENQELELAFYKAEKQRMDIKFEFQENLSKQARELNKELQKAVKQEKEKVRRMSQTLSSTDVDEIDNVNDGSALPLEEQVNKLKDQLTKEQMEKQILQQRLSNAESTQVNKLLQYVNSTKKPMPPPPPKKQISANGDSDGDGGEEEDGNVSPLEQDEEEEEDDNKHEADSSGEMETLKFKLANAELQNAQLKRRVSIAGIEKEQLSLLWEQPRVTIQMVSEFIERLPLKHKEKIWARHATGQYIAKNKVLHTLHSFVALCIKIKDRTAVAPSRHDIEKKLVPFADVIRQRTENMNGMALDEFNNELHFWILEPVSGLIMTSDEQKQWMDEIDQLRDELVKTQKEKLRIQRKSQMDLTVLLDKMKGFEIQPEEKIAELEEHIEELQDAINDLQSDRKEKDEEIKGLMKDNFNLRQGRDKSRESEDDEEEEEKEEVEEDEDEEEEEDEEEQVPELIDASQQKTMSEFRDLQDEERFEEERLEYSRNDSNVTKSQSYIGWKNKAVSANEEISKLQRERKLSSEQLTRLTQTVEELKASRTADTNMYESQASGFKSTIAKFKKKYQESDKIRKDSISTLHDNLFAKLLEAEAEHEEMVADFKQQIGRLLKSKKALETAMNTMATTKVDTIGSLANTIQELRESVTALSKQVEILKNKNNRLESRTTVQHITSSFSSWMG